MDKSAINVAKRRDTENSNAVTMAYCISRLVEAILKRDSENLKSTGGEHPELQVLREKCKDKDAAVSTTACQALVTLVEAGVVSIPNMLSTFVAMLPYFHTYVGVTSALGQLLILDMKMRIGPNQTYKCPFNLVSPQHPLVTILKQNKDAWLDVISQIEFVCHNPDQVVQENASQLVKPVVLYIICDPNNTSAALPFRQQLWKLLLTLPTSELLQACIPWLQVENLLSTPSLYIQLSMSNAVSEDVNELSKSHLVLALASIVDTQVTKGCDPRATLRALTELMQDYSCTFTGSCVISILANAISKSPPIYLAELILTCSKLVECQLCTTLAGQTLTAALLPWMAYPSLLISQALHEAQAVLKKMDDLKGVIMTEAPFKTHSFPIAHFYVCTYRLFSSWTSDTEKIVFWLKTSKLVGHECSLLLGALLIDDEGSSMVLSASLAALLSLVKTSPHLGTFVLTWLLFRMAREKIPCNQLALLKALPILGEQKENACLVILTLESLKSNVTMRPLVLHLYLRLWRLSPRCFPYLHKLLLEDNHSPIIDLKWEIAKAVAMKEICDIRPSQHGTDMVPILSKILNCCVSKESALASSLALQAISSLCRAKVVDVATTWRTLAPRLTRDSREIVLISLCEILGLMSEIRSSNPDQAKLFAEAQSRLWSFIMIHKNTDVVNAALRALSQFSLEQFSLKTLPVNYRQGLKLPPEYAKTPIDAARKPEDVLPYIPGECWVQLLGEISEATVFVSALLEAEVSGMRGALNRLPGRAEPSLPRLMPSSICLALISCIRNKQDDVDSSVVACLKVLAQPKLLPPCDWSCLSKLVTKEECRHLSMSIAAVQAVASPSAQAVIEELIKTLYVQTSQSKDILFAFSILGDLCKSVSPNTLRPFIEMALQTALSDAQSQDSTRDVTQFRELMSHLKTALARDDIHEANRTLLSIVLESLLEVINLDNEEVFSCYINTAGEISNKFIERMTSPSVWWEVTSIKLRKSILIRSGLATRLDSKTPLVWLNECIDATATNPQEQDLLLRQLVHVIQVVRDAEISSKEWLLQLMGHVQAALTSSDKRAEAVFLCDIFTLGVIVLAKHDSLVTDPLILVEDKSTRLDLLPQALLCLLTIAPYYDITSQVIDWLHHMIKSSVIGSDLNSELYKCLQALRHSSALCQTSVWPKVVTL